jgi:hypothetical protein
MQCAKDSFYVALRDRLARLNPTRTICIRGITRPAVLVIENEMPTAALIPERVFVISWGTTKVSKEFAGSDRPLTGLECSITYGTSGSGEDGIDRGRLLTTLDSELIQICTPPFTEKRDYTNPDSASLGGNVFWTAPQIEVRKTKAGDSGAWRSAAATPLFHTATLILFCYPEVA